MSLDQIAQVCGIAGSVGIVLSMLFVGLQIRQQTSALNRSEHNSTMEQWTVIRMAIAKHRDIAELMTEGLQGRRRLDAADQLRLDMLLNEHMWAAFHIWDREQRGIFPSGAFDLTGARYVLPLLETPGGVEWWGRSKNAGFLPPYVAVIDTLLARRAQARGEVPR
jgi:hypothetical protein